MNRRLPVIGYTEEIEDGPTPAQVAARRRAVNDGREERAGSSVPGNRWLPNEKALAQVVDYNPREYRNRVRAECLGGARPCPFVSCRHHLYLTVDPGSRTIKFHFPDREVWELDETCSLDVADDGEQTLDRIGELQNLTRERVRQIEARGLKKMGPDAALIDGRKNDGNNER